MANYSHQVTLTANTASTYSFANYSSNVRVYNLSTSNPIYAVCGDITGSRALAAPTVAGDDTWVIPVSSWVDVPNQSLPPEPAQGITAGTNVQLISAGTGPAHLVLSNRSN